MLCDYTRVLCSCISVGVALRGAVWLVHLHWGDPGEISLNDDTLIYVCADGPTDIAWLSSNLQGMTLTLNRVLQQPHSCR